MPAELLVVLFPRGFLYLACRVGEDVTFHSQLHEESVVLGSFRIY
jgi:hypothetical protein